MPAVTPTDLTPERALIFRITHVDNLPWVLENGLRSQASGLRDPQFVPIGNEELITKRSARQVPVGPGGTLGDYVPFYFTPWSPMLMNILTGRNVQQRRPEEIVFIVTSLSQVEEAGRRYVVSDRHAYLQAAEFAEGRDRLATMVDWSRLQNRDFRRDPDHPEAFDRYQAEALVHERLPVGAILGLACYTSSVSSDLDRLIEERDIELPVADRRDWYPR